MFDIPDDITKISSALYEFVVCNGADAQARNNARDKLCGKHFYLKAVSGTGGCITHWS